MKAQKTQMVSEYQTSVKNPHILLLPYRTSCKLSSAWNSRKLQYKLKINLKRIKLQKGRMTFQIVCFTTTNKSTGI